MLLNVPLATMEADYFKTTKKSNLEGTVLYEADKGFMTFIHKEDAFIVPDVYGNGIYWLKKAEKMARNLGCNRLVGGTTRNVKAYNRMFGTKIVGYILEKEL